MMVVNSETLKDNPALGKALTGAWYEMMGLMKAQDATVLNAMAAASGTDLAGYQAQLKTTHLFYTPQDNIAFLTSPELAKTMQRVATFSFDKGLLGDGAQSADFIGMRFPGNVTQGDASNVKLRFDDSFVKMAAAGTL
jgi:NitT/TauT family transport system substrate-binding protein